jgi:signal transduction histidine kinase
VTAIAALVIFAPARNRLRELERAAERFGAGELSTRASAHGRDEIAHVATAFNHMAADLEQRTDALQISDRLRRQMLADISHELRTPLTTMRGYLDTLDMPEIVLGRRQAPRYVDTARRETIRLEHIVSDLLELARFENGVAAIAPRVVAVERVLSGVAPRFERDAAAANVTIRTCVDPAADQIVADPDRLDQAISNLVANALRHTQPGGTIDLDATYRRQRVPNTVVDSGRGIAPTISARVRSVLQSGCVEDVRAGGQRPWPVDRQGHRRASWRNVSVTSQPGRTAFVITLPQP